MKIDNEFTVGAPIEKAWDVLTDLEGIAPCLPGAQLTGVDGDVYTGKVKIKVGPVISQYAGTAEMVEKDDATHTAVIRAKGKDSRGAGNASATISAKLRAEGAETVVTVVTDLNITGKIAQFGSGMIKEVSTKLLGQFAENLETQVLAPAPDAAASDAITPEAAPEPAAPAAEATVTPVTPTTPVTPAAAPRSQLRTATQNDDVAPVDIMGLAGSSVYKRVLPVAGGIVVAAVIVYFIVR